MSKVTVREMRELERLFGAEVEGAPTRVYNKNLAAKLERLGLIQEYEHHWQDQLGFFTWKSHVLTHAGRYIYCSRCTEPNRPVSG